MRWCSSAPIARSRLSTRLRRYPFSPVGSHPSDDWQKVGLLRCLRCFYVRQHRRSTKADTRILRTQGETSRPGQLADTSIKDWHRAQRKIECWAITRLARRGRRAEEPPRLSSTTQYILQELGRPLITVFMSSCKRVYRRMPVAGHPFCYTLPH